MIDRNSLRLIGLHHRVDDAGCVVDPEVDLAGGGVALILVHQGRQRAGLLPESGQHVQRGQHPGVRTPELAEVVVRGMLATEDGAGLGHQRLDVGVPDPGAQRDTAVLGDHLRHRPRGDQVVDHRRTRFAVQFPRSDQCGHRRRRDRLAAFIDDEAAIGVTVEGQADIGPGGDHIALQILEVGRVQRVGLVIGKGSVEFEVQRQQGQCLDRSQHCGCGVPSHPVARVDRNAQRPHAADIDQ